MLGRPVRGRRQPGSSACAVSPTCGARPAAAGAVRRRRSHPIGTGVRQEVREFHRRNPEGAPRAQEPGPSAAREANFYDGVAWASTVEKNLK